MTISENPRHRSSDHLPIVHEGKQGREGPGPMTISDEMVVDGKKWRRLDGRYKMARGVGVLWKLNFWKFYIYFVRNRNISLLKVRAYFQHPNYH